MLCANNVAKQVESYISGKKKLCTHCGNSVLHMPCEIVWVTRSSLFEVSEVMSRPAVVLLQSISLITASEPQFKLYSV